MRIGELARSARAVLAASLLLCAASAAVAAPAHALDALLSQAVDRGWRSAAHKARDRYRHPVQTLEFFGLRPDMMVIELEPGAGWYTEILAPVLRARGTLIEAAPPLDAKKAFVRRMAARFEQKLESDPAVYGNVKLVPFDPPRQVELGPRDSADMVLTFRNAHNWLNEGPKVLAKVFAPPTGCSSPAASSASSSIARARTQTRSKARARSTASPRTT